MLLHSGDRELQIKLAELQTDVQTILRVAFGFTASFLAISVTAIQVLLDMGSGFSRDIVAVVAFGCIARENDFDCFIVVLLLYW